MSRLNLSRFLHAYRFARNWVPDQKNMQVMSCEICGSANIVRDDYLTGLPIEGKAKINYWGKYTCKACGATCKEEQSWERCTWPEKKTREEGK
jgi:hypothetical protein